MRPGIFYAPQKLKRVGLLLQSWKIYAGAVGLVIQYYLRPGVDGIAREITRNRFRFAARSVLRSKVRIRNAVLMAR
jgi:hypothetical protein